MNARIQRMLDRAHRSYMAPWTEEAGKTVILGEDDLLAGGNACMRYAEERPKAVCFGRQSFTPHFPMKESLAVFFREGVLCAAGNHTTMDYETIFRIGFRGLVGRIDEQLEKTAADTGEAALEKRRFWTSLRKCAEDHIAFCRRHADAAEAQARQCADAARVRELAAIAEHCRRVVEYPPRDFWEACQCAWFAFLYLSDAPGRVDQYLYPYFRRDIDEGRITREFAKELISGLWIKYYELAGAAQAVSAFHHITLGGSTPDGRDASNELTDLCLEVTAELGLHRPQVGLRWNRHMPRERLVRALKVLKAGTGSPDICNDEVIVPALTGIGVSPEDARDFSLSGCHEVVIAGKAQMGSVEGFVNFPKTLRMALGLEPALHKSAPLESMRTFDDVLAAFGEAMETTACMAHEYAVECDRLAAESDGGQGASLVVADCIAGGRGYHQGGARYNFCNFNLIGIANVADSLAAIRELVFDRKELSLAELARILSGNWAGSEPLRKKILNRASQYGNDDPATDSLAAEQVRRFGDILRRHKPFRGGEYILGTTAGGENMHIEFGRMTGATPDGRKAGDPVADSMGAAQGRDRMGVTALLNSVARLPHGRLPTAATLNVKLDPGLLSTRAGVEKLAMLVESHFMSGGQQFQFNLVNAKMLRDARACPEKYPDLMVRVAGYCAQFASLWPDLQDEIISRTEYAVL